MRSLAAAKALASENGAEVEFLVVADRIDQATMDVVNRFAPIIDRVEKVEFGDLGAARQYGIDHATADWVFMHDGDDLFSTNWYSSFASLRAQGAIDASTIYHTNLFLGFEREIFFRLMLDSDDPSFDPLYLASEWYFSNKAVAHKKIFDQFPFPHNDLRQGIGNEDWTWSCHTLHAGIRHSFIPETICFYRLKPPEESLGLVPGVVHGASELFSPDAVRNDTRERRRRHFAESPFAKSATKKAVDSAREVYIHDWVWKEVAAQAVFEPLISDIYELPPSQRKYRVPNLHTNVSRAWRDCCELLDNREKAILFLSTYNNTASDYLVELLVEAMDRVYGGACQPVLVLDEPSEHIDPNYFWEKYGAAVVSTATLRSRYSLEDWYLYRYLMRILVQFSSSIIVDFGSDVFKRMFDEFNRPVCSLHRNIVFAYTEADLDILAPAYQNVLAGALRFEEFTRRPASFFSLSSDFSELAQSHGRIVRQGSSALMAAWSKLLLQRYRREPERRIDLANDVRFDELFHDWSELKPSRLAALAGQVRTTAEKPWDNKHVRLFQSANTWLAEDLPRQASLLMDGNPQATILVPQIIVWKKRNRRVGSMWLDNSRILNDIAGVFEFMLLHNVEIPFFVFVRAETDIARYVGDSSHKSMSAVELLSHILRFEHKPGSILALPDSVCAGDESHSTPPSSLRLLKPHPGWNSSETPSR
jgi:glycosyltransferase involved in cell wall biosynthesis